MCVAKRRTYKNVNEWLWLLQTILELQRKFNWCAAAALMIVHASSTNSLLSLVNYRRILRQQKKTLWIDKEFHSEWFTWILHRYFEREHEKLLDAQYCFTALWSLTSSLVSLMNDFGQDRATEIESLNWYWISKWKHLRGFRTDIFPPDGNVRVYSATSAIDTPSNMATIVQQPSLEAPEFQESLPLYLMWKFDC